ncbi:hypothetical protein GUI26_00915 [Escherichia coli]|nr:hypothetical protein [Escherichia coli]
MDKAGKEGPNRILYFHTDVNGAPEEMTDSDGKIVWETGYQVWGNTIQEKDHGGVEQNLRYQGQYLDRETGLHYNLHRYYDPDVGRFMVTDPIGLGGKPAGEARGGKGHGRKQRGAVQPADVLPWCALPL